MVGQSEYSLMPVEGVVSDASSRQKREIRTLPQLGVLQHVVGGKLVRVDPLQAEDLDARAREAALRGLGGALHEEDDGGGANGLVDGLADGVGEEAALGGQREEERRGPEGGGDGADRGERRFPGGLDRVRVSTETTTSLGGWHGLPVIIWCGKTCWRGGGGVVMRW